MEATGDHEVYDGVTLLRKPQDNPLPDTEDFLKISSHKVLWRGLHGTQDKRTDQPDPLKRLPDQHFLKALNVHGDVREFRHGDNLFSGL